MELNLDVQPIFKINQYEQKVSSVSISKCLMIFSEITETRWQKLELRSSHQSALSTFHLSNDVPE